MTMITIVFAYLCIILAFSFNISIFLSQIKRLYKLSNKESFYSVISAIIVLLLSLLLFFYFGLIAKPPNDIVIILIVGILFSFFIIYNLIARLYFKFFKKQSGNQTNNKQTSLQSKNSNYELLRKSFHFLIFFGIIAYIFILLSILNYMYANTSNPNIFKLIDNYWGPNAPINNYTDMQQISPSGIALLTFFIIAAGLMMMNEASRLNSKIYFPLSSAAKLFLREKEYLTFASYLYFVIGMIFSSLLLTIFPILAILATLSFGDSSYALIGKRFGKHKIPFNSIKSIEGSIGGFLVTLISTSIFVGILYGLVAAIIFTIIDVITPRIPMCDNIMGPIFITLGFCALGLVGLPLGGLTILFI